MITRNDGLDLSLLYIIVKQIAKHCKDGKLIEEGNRSQILKIVGKKWMGILMMEIDGRRMRWQERSDHNMGGLISEYPEFE